MTFDPPPLPPPLPPGLPATPPPLPDLATTPPAPPAGSPPPPAWPAGYAPAPPRARRRPGTVPACPQCGTPLDLDTLVAGPQLCFHCAASFEATPFWPPPPYLPPRRLAEAGPAGAAPCAVHPGNAALGTCDRCGLFACALCCSEILGQRLCAACIDRQIANRGLPLLRSSYVDLPGLAVTCGLLLLLLSVFGVVTGPLTIGLAVAAARQKQRGETAGGWLAILLAGGLGLAQLGMGIFFIVRLVQS